MDEKLLSDGPGKRVLLLGNEAIVRGALEAGVQFASTFPGTPTSEIGDAWVRISKQAGIYFEYSTNEKVAFEAAAGASFAGLRSMVSFKHFGINVASDSIFPVAYVGVDGGLVVVYADDPQGWSSAQSEQDSRPYAKMAHMPMFEPSNSQECLEMIKRAFELSESTRLPVFFRSTTRVSHTRSIVKLGKIKRGKRKAFFKKDLEKYNNMPPKIVRMHEDISNKIEQVREMSEESDLNFIINHMSGSELGIIVSGVSYNYVIDAMEALGVRLPVLKLGMTYPLPEKKISGFIRKLRSVMVVEELEPFIETQVRALAKEANPKLNIIGKANGDKKIFPVSGEYTSDSMIAALAKVLGKKAPFDYKGHMRLFEKSMVSIPTRFPVFCPGCPHRATFYAVKQAVGKDAVFGGDIGCYIIGMFPPYETQDFSISMGAGMGVTHGIKKAEDQTGSSQKVIAFIGDGTFFHAGVPALLNMVYNKSNVLVVLMDNRVTAMTGHQPNPGSGVSYSGEPEEAVEIEPLIRACGVRHVKTVDPYNIQALKDAVKEYMGNDSLSVIIAKHKCFLVEAREKRKAGIDMPKFEIAGNLPIESAENLRDWACPALHRNDRGEMRIDESVCAGCGSCVQIAPGKIRAKPLKG
jgi:indolepyruvate ferredoxin oxidoreductase, alpha subunit